MFGRIGPWELGIIFMVFLALPAYLIPTIIAAIRKTKHSAGIILLNIFAGWTFFGWVGSLVWAIVDEKQARDKA